MTSTHEAPPGARAMNVVRWALFAFLLLLAVGTVSSYVAWRLGAGKEKHAAATATWHCPMHPTYTSDRPGECPICGMNLTRIQRDGGAGAGRGDVPGLTGVEISPERVQLIGVRTGVVERVALGDELDLVGFVTPDESRLRRIQLRVAGWVRALHVDRTGERVAAGQPLLTIYSPELYQSEQEYLIQRGTAMPGMPDMHGGAGAPGDRLRLLGVPDEEIRRLEREGAATSELVLRSPVAGTVLERGVTAGQSVGPDTPLFTVAELSRVWVLADVYEMDLGRVKVGDVARFFADGEPGRSHEGRIEFIYPTVSSATRTVQARVVLENRDGSLRPGMFGRVRVAGRNAPSLAVPSEAVVRAGEHDYVFLARAGGRFEPRKVTTGASAGDRVAILAGLAAGDTIVTSASFLIDSESRLEAAISGMSGGMEHAHGSTP